MLFDRSAIFLAPMLCLVAAPAWSEARLLFMERAILSAADARCNLLSPDEKRALESGYWQTRGELLRNGFTKDTMDAFNQEAARTIERKGCNDQHLQESINKLRQAFIVFARTPSMSYVSDHATWQAWRRPENGWYILQIRNNLQFGLFADQDDPPKLAIGVTIPYGNHSAARISMRDPERLQEPWLGDIMGRSNKLRSPPGAIIRTFWASDKRYDEQGTIIWLFPEAARQMLLELDPREAVLIELRLPDGSGRFARRVFEIGDYRAAKAFSAIAVAAKSSSK